MPEMDGLAATRLLDCACDILVNSESTWTTYRDAYFQSPHWVAQFPAHRFWHLVHDCPSEGEMRTALWLARSRNAGSS